MYTKNKENVFEHKYTELKKIEKEKNITKIPGWWYT